MKTVSVWSLSRLEPEPTQFGPAPGPRTSEAGAAQKSGGSATLVAAHFFFPPPTFRRPPGPRLLPKAY